MRRRLLSACLLVTASAPLLAASVANPAVAARYQQLLQSHPEPGVALDRLWKLYEDADATDELLQNYAQQSTFPGTLVYGYLLQHAGRIPEARAAFEKAAALDVKSDLPHKALAPLLDDPAESAAEWEKAATFNPSLETLLSLGNAWQRGQEPDKATAAWERAAQLDPQNLLLHEQLAANYEQNHLPEMAVEHYQFIAQIGEPARRAGALQKMARLYDALQQPEKAEQALDQALTLVAPGHWLRQPIEAQLIRLCQRNGRLPELEKRWTEEVAQTPGDLGGYWKLADLYQQLGDSAQERTSLEKMATLAPQTREILSRLAQVQRASGDARAAAATLDELLKNEPGDSELAFARAELDLQLDQPGAASARLDQLIAEHPNDDALTNRVLDFYRRARLQGPLEQHLRAQAAQSADGVLALTRFLFSERRADEAKSALQKLARPTDDPATQAAAWIRVATELKAQRLDGDALSALRQAAALTPQDPSGHIALADALADAAQYEEARAQMLLAWQLNPSDANDEKLFQIFQAERQGQQAADFSTSEDQPKLDEQDETAFRDYLAQLTRTARASNSAAASWRASRWLNWSQRNDEALDFARRARELDPTSLPARKQLVRVLLALSNPAGAQEQLAQLIKIDPAHVADWQRQLGQLQLDSGRINDALQTFQALVEASPKDTNALANLALAQQRTEHWSDALTTWQRAFALTPTSQRREAAQPLLLALEHLGLFQKGAETLLKVADGLNDPATRSSALADAQTFATRHDLRPWFSAQLETRLLQNPSDLPTLRAVAQLRQESGDPEGALQLMQHAAEQTPDDAALLREIVRMAATLGRPDEAISQQRRLVQMSPQNDPSELQALAKAEEQAGDISGATATWLRIARQFPRDPLALTKAADFLIRWQQLEAAREALRRVRVLDPGNLAALSALAQLGESAESMSCFEQILQHSSPSKPGDPLTFPGMTGRGENFQQTYFQVLQVRNRRADGPLTMQLETLWQNGGATPTVDAAWRLSSIQALASKRDESNRRDWLARWPVERADSETLWAHYFAHDAEGTIRVLNAMLTARPRDPQVRQSYVWLSLCLGQYAQLGRWLIAPERDADDLDFFWVAIARYASQSPTDVAWLGELFPAGSKLSFEKWQTAALLAAHGRLDGAILLGSAVFENEPSQRQTTGVLLAQWQIYADQVEAARQTLRRSVDFTGSTLDESIYDVLRQCVLLLPTGERADFERDYLAHWKDSPLHVANARLLFAALGNDVAAIKMATDTLIQMSPTPVRDGQPMTAEVRYWSFWVTAGTQLENWSLRSAANTLWSAVLEDRAASALRSGQVPELARELRLRALAARIVAASPGGRTFLLQNFAENSTPESLATLGALMTNAGCLEQTQAIFRTLWQRAPSDQQALRGLVNSSRALGDLDSAQEALLAALATLKQAQAPVQAVRALAVETATLQRQNNQRRAAAKVMEEALAQSPQDAGLLTLSARFALEDGQEEAAETAYRKLLLLPNGKDAASSALQTLLRRQGREQEAEALGKSAELERPILDQPKVLNDAVQALIKAGKKDEALGRLWSALDQETDAGRRFEWQSQIAALLGRDDPRLRPLLAQMHAALSAATRAGKRRAEDEDWAKRALQFYASYAGLTTKGNSDLSRWLIEDWDAGRGVPEAGAALVRFYADAQDQAALAALIRQTIRDASALDSAPLLAMAQQLERSNCPDLTTDLQRAIFQNYPIQQQNLGFTLIQKIAHQGDLLGAAKWLDALAARCIFDATLVSPVATAYADLKNIPAARRYWAWAVAGNPTAQDSGLWLLYADFLSSQNDPAAPAAWRKTYSNRANLNFTRIFDRLGKNASLAEATDSATSLSLSPAQERAFWRGWLHRLDQQQNFDGAIELALRYPEAVINDARSLDLVATATAKTARFAEITAWLEPITVQRSADLPWLPRTLAAIYQTQAGQERSHDRRAAIGHLERATQLVPLDFTAAQSLCQLYQDDQRAKDALFTMQKFKAKTRNLKDRAQAEEWLKSAAL